MPFLKAGFNARNRDTGIRAWTRHIGGGKFASAELRRLDSGDYFWLDAGDPARFLTWGEQVVIGTRPEFDLPDDWQFGLPQSAVAAKPALRAGKVSLTIIGEPVSKANSRELVMVGHGASRRPLFIKSEKARNYERDALLQVPPRARLRLEGPVRLTATLYYATERPDLDASLIRDVLQDRYEKVNGERVLIQRGVYRNDRQVREEHYYHAIDRRNPRAEVEIEPIAEQAALAMDNPAPQLDERDKAELPF